MTINEDPATRGTQPIPKDDAGDAPPPSKMKRVASASFIGSLIEFYDFNIYAYAAALVFGKVFFPALGPAAATVASFATLGVAFIARPIGAVVFGHFGDRLGRKKTLITTMLMMGFATFAVGLMPTAATIGVAAPILLVILRVVQGFAAGGEYAGAALYAAENAPGSRRGFWAMFASLGTGAAITAAPATLLLANAVMSEEAFLSYGWRIPFLSSILLVGVGLWMRLKMDETPVFKQDSEARNSASKIPFFEACKRQPRVLVLTSGVWALVSATGYMGVTFLSNYGRNTLGLTFNSILVIGTIGGVVFTVAIALGGHFSDRFGRRRVVIAAAVTAIALLLVMFPIIEAGGVLFFGFAVAATMFTSGIATGPMSAYTSELFRTRYRYTGMALTNSAGNVIGGGIMPILGASIVASHGGQAFGFVMAGLAAVGLICVLGLPETRNAALSPGDPAAPTDL